MGLERLVVPIEWKATDDAQTLEGYASTFGNVDLGGDVVVKGAFKKTIANIKANGIPLLADHVPSVNSVLGTIYDAVEDGKGLKIWAKFSSAQSAQDARTKLVEGHVNRMSIGYELPDGGFKFGDKDGRRVRYLTEIKLWETSVVVFPMNPEAVISTVKSMFDAADLGSEYDALVREAKDALARATGTEPDPEGKATANETREALQKSLAEYHKGTEEWAYLRDFDDAKVWYELYGNGSKGQLFERTYDIDDAAAVTLGETSTKVRAVVTYVAIDESDDSKGTTLRLGETKTSEDDESSSSGDDPEQKAADPAAPAGDDPAVSVPDEGAPGWDRWSSQALLNGREDAKADEAKRAGLEQQLELMEADVNRSRDLLKASAFQVSEPTD